jgi:hypothetical protein
MALLKDGYQTLITFAEDPTVEFYEKTVTPPGMDAGGANDTSTMRTERWRTRYPKALVTATDISLTAAYDPVVYDSIVDMLGVNQLITIAFPDGSTLVIWGWLNEFRPGEHREGEQPVATVTIMCSNVNDSDVETPPVYTAA